MKTIKIDLDDVRAAGSVTEAVRAAVRDRGNTLLADSSALGGQTFATSGPGSGWTRTFDAGDYASAAIGQDVAASGGNPSDSEAIDPEDGRVARGVAPEADEDWDGSVEWSDESIVEVVCPEVEDALEYPETVAKIAEAVIDYHGDRSSRKAWAALIRLIRTAAERLESINLDKLEG